MLSGLPDGVTVTSGGVTAPASFDETDDQQIGRFFGDDGVAKVYGRVVRLAAGTFTGLARGDSMSVTVDGTATSYTVREVVRHNDGNDLLVALVAA